MQLPLTGDLPSGQYLRGIGADGVIHCEPIFFWPTFTSSLSLGSSPSIAIGADGLPVISYSLSGFVLSISHCGNPACSAGNVSTDVDEPAPGVSVGGFLSITVGADGFPVISHYNSTAQALRITKCGKAACTAGSKSSTCPS